MSRRGLLLKGPLDASTGDRLQVQIDVEGGIELPAAVRHVTNGDVGVELLETDPRWVQWILDSGGEQRHSPRRSRRLLVWLEVPDAALGLFTADISRCGAYLVTPNAFDNGAVLDLELVDEANSALRLRGQVVRQGSGGVGVRFIEMSDEHTQRLEALLKAA